MSATTDYIIMLREAGFFPDERTCYVLFCPECGATEQTRNLKPSSFTCNDCMTPKELDLNGIPETSKDEVYRKAVNWSCIRSMASTTSLF